MTQKYLGHTIDTLVPFDCKFSRIALFIPSWDLCYLESQW